MNPAKKKFFITASIEDVSILRKFAILFLLTSIVPISLLYFVYLKNPGIGALSIGLAATGVLIGYFAIRLLLVKAIGVAKQNRKAIEAYLDPQTVHRLNEPQNELVVLSDTFSAVTRQLERNIQELKAKNEELKELDRLKDDFVNHVSHELRLPLAIVQESIRQMAEGLLGQVNDQQLKYLNMSLKNIARLRTMIDNILDVAKIKKGKYQLNRQRIDFKEVIRETASDLLSKVTAKGLSLKTSLPEQRLEVFADKDKMTQVLLNLIGNACKFTDHGTIEVSARDNGEQVECSVGDSGIGMAPADLQQLFSAFHQVGQSRNQNEKGSGLGLVLTKNIIELHGGRIFVQSQQGRGTTFTFTVPKNANQGQNG